jgi:hypothetical protein
VGGAALMRSTADVGGQGLAAADAVMMDDEEAQIRLAMEMSLAEASAQKEHPQPPPQRELAPVQGGAAATTAKSEADTSSVVAVDLRSATPQDGAARSEVIDVTTDASDQTENVVAASADTQAKRAVEHACPARYRLCATVWHAGTHASSGHYIADVRRTERLAAPSAAGAPASVSATACATSNSASVERWQRFDDSFVRAVPANAPDAETKGYIFFYVHDSLL